MKNRPDRRPHDPAKSCWDLLGIARHATEAEVERAHLARAAKLRKRGSESRAELAELNAARDEAHRQLVLDRITSN